MTRVFTGPSAGMFLALGGGITLSLNDLAIKALSGAYALHQIILIRALVGMAPKTTAMSRPGRTTQR